MGVCTGESWCPRDFISVYEVCTMVYEGKTIFVCIWCTSVRGVYEAKRVSRTQLNVLRRNDYRASVYEVYETFTVNL